MTTSLLLGLGALLGLGTALASPPPTTSPAPGPSQPATVIRSFAAVRPAFAPGCTAYLANWGQGQIFWGGCSTSACGDAYNNPCQGNEGPEGVLYCLCEQGTLVKCLSLVSIDAGGAVLDWECLTIMCANECSKTTPPAPLEPGVPALFYSCDC